MTGATGERTALYSPSLRYYYFSILRPANSGEIYEANGMVWINNGKPSKTSTVGGIVDGA